MPTFRDLPCPAWLNLFVSEISDPALHHRGVPLTAFYIFIIRAVLSTFFAVLVMRFFYPKAGIPSVMGCAIVLVGMAYVLESFRKRKKGP